MLLENNKKVLIYSLEDKEKELLKNFLDTKNLPNLININEEMGRMTIKDILNNLKFQVCNCSLPKEKTIIFNNFSDIELDEAIKFIKGSFTEMPILAVVTEKSIDWTFEDLIKHLIEEREWFKAQKR